MKLATKKPNNNSSARVVDGKLILSYPEALTPVVWQMDLSQAKASALEVRENKGNFTLTLKTAKGETVDVVSFATKDEAVAALMGASNALQNAHGQIRPFGVVENGAAPSPRQQITPATADKRSRWTAGVLGVLLVLVLLAIWGSLAPRPPMNAGDNASASGAAGGPASFGQQDENGVPLSADEFLIKHKAR